jgi:hemerythrin-like metal-binding protein
MFNKKPDPNAASSSSLSAKAQRLTGIEHALTQLSDLDFRFLPSGLDSDLAPVLEGLRERLGRLLGTVQGQGRLFQASTSELTSTTRLLMENAQGVRQNAVQVAGASAQMSANMGAVSAAAEELSVNMQAISENARQSKENTEVIARSTHELTLASQEIARSTEKARSVSDRAVADVENAVRQVTGLETAAAEISQVTNTISEISDQTKLLALNATIEAARAGEAGRGFAVVAGEVKQLASQTNTATRNIKEKIEVIQGAIHSTITAINSISAVINEVNQIVGIIATAAEEQSATTKDIAGNISDTTDRIADMTNSVTEGALAVQDVNRNIAQAAQLAQGVAESARSIAEANGQITRTSTAAYAHAMEVHNQAELLAEETQELQVDPIFVTSSQQESVLFRFRPKYSVLIEKMDGEHQRIFDFINRIHMAIKQSKSEAEILPIFREMAAFTREHFAHEEAMMIRLNYPGYNAQKQMHTKLLDTVAGYVEALNSGRSVDLISALVFLSEWLQEHILKVDRQYGEYFKERGILVEL